MALSVVFHPTSAFEHALFEPNKNKALTTVSLAGLFLAIAVFLLTHSIIYAGFVFVINLINWIVFGGIIFFFEFAHTKKKSRGSEKNFWGSACVAGTLWEINLLAYLVLAIGTLVIPFLSGIVFTFAVGALFVILILAVVVWIVASFKMLKVVFGAERGKLIVNWLIFMVINALFVSFINRLLAALIF